MSKMKVKGRSVPTKKKLFIVADAAVDTGCDK